MDLRWIVEALVDLWPELPDLFRPAWREVFPQLERALAGLRASPPAAERAAHLRRLAEVLGSFPAVRVRMEEARERRRIQRSEHPSLSPPDWPQLRKGIDSCLAPPLIRRRAEIQAPSRLSTNRVGIVEVALLTGAEDGDTAVEVRARQFVEVHLQGTPGVVEVLSPAVRRLWIEAGRDSASLRFHLRGHQPGAGRLLVDFLQSGVLLRRSVHEIEVSTTQEVDPSLIASPIELSTGGPYRLGADLDLMVVLWQLDGRSRLTYCLNSSHSAVDVSYRKLGGPTFEMPGEAYQKHLIERMEGVRRGEADLEQIGHELYDQLFPEPMRITFSEFCGKVSSLQIVSDEPWIPWELLKPYGSGPSGEKLDDKFLGERFRCTRWVSGPGKAETLQISRLACIEVEGASDGERLAYPSQDRHVLAELAREAGLEDLSPRQAVVGKVKSLFAQDEIDLFHVAAPGEIRLDGPAVARIFLRDGGNVSDRDVPPFPLPAGERPLVFFNVPYAAQQGMGLTRLEGWVQAWVAGGRCGAFIAPLWKVSDPLAHLFAATFYQSLRQESTIGDAFARARDRVKQEAPDDPAWISYCLYANPNAEVVFVRATANAR